jgi:hypothetical protein
MPNRTVVCGATGASWRYAIHSPLTNRLIGDHPSRTITQPTPKLSGRVIEESWRQLNAQLASPDLTYSPRQTWRNRIGWTVRTPTRGRWEDV